MSDLDALLGQIPIGEIAKKLGVDESTAEAAVKQVLPTLVSGMAANAKDDAGAQSLEKALGKHSGRTVSVASVDEADGNAASRNRPPTSCAMSESSRRALSSDASTATACLANTMPASVSLRDRPTLVVSATPSLFSNRRMC